MKMLQMNSYLEFEMNVGAEFVVEVEYVGFSKIELDDCICDIGVVGVRSN
jgi:hypothetical protein